jgi:hypothetical protein
VRRIDGLEMPLPPSDSSRALGRHGYPDRLKGTAIPPMHGSWRPAMRGRRCPRPSLPSHAPRGRRLPRVPGRGWD